VHYRTPRALSACVASLTEQTDPPSGIVVVDNSASFSGAEMTQSASHGTDLIRPDRNLGFAAGCNAGAARSTSEFILFLNPDIRLDRTALAAMLRQAGMDHRTAVVAPRIYGRDGRVEQNARSFPTVRTGLLGRSSVATRLLRTLGHVPAELIAERDETDADWVSGACMLVRRAAFAEVGGFDERYFMYWEDADLCRRLRDTNWKVRLEPSAIASHATGSSGKSAHTIRAFHRSAERFARKYLAHGKHDGFLMSVLLRARMYASLASHAAARRARSTLLARHHLSAASRQRCTY
jgi:N-acetylglucosaminyl-diphospho-decaprenol L-rhamnosyltransferase